MTKRLLFILILLPYLGYSQTNISSWTRNANGKKASYWATAQSGMSVTYSYGFYSKL